MTTTATIGHNTRFEIATDNSPTFEEVGEVLSVNGLSIARDAIDATHNTSPNAWREFIAGLKDGGEVSLELNFDPGSATTTLLLGEFDDQTANSYRLVFPDGSIWAFSGIATGFEPEDPIDDKMTATFTVKVTGQPTLTQA